jgi:hypothetical protein
VRKERYRMEMRKYISIVLFVTFVDKKKKIPQFPSRVSMIPRNSCHSISFPFLLIQKFPTPSIQESFKCLSPRSVYSHPMTKPAMTPELTSQHSCCYPHLPNSLEQITKVSIRTRIELPHHLSPLSITELEQLSLIHSTKLQHRSRTRSHFRKVQKL